MKQINLLITFFSFLFLFASCSKESSSNNSKKDLLTSRPWVIQKVEEKTNANPWGDSFPSWQACKKDDKWIFKTDFSLEYNEAANACSGSSPNLVLDIVTWAFSETETKLAIDGVIMTIEQLNDSMLIISASEVISGVTHQTRITLGH